jgi:hypothetical protein
VEAGAAAGEVTADGETAGVAGGGVGETFGAGVCGGASVGWSAGYVKGTSRM